MSNLEKLDSVLNTMIAKRFQRHIDLQFLFESHSSMGVEFGEVTSIMNKLEKDGYVNSIRTPIPDTGSHTLFYSVSFDGLVFAEQGGYSKNLSFEKINLEVVDLRNKVLDYDKKIGDARIMRNVAILSAIVSVLSAIIAWIALNKK